MTIQQLIDDLEKAKETLGPNAEVSVLNCQIASVAINDDDSVIIDFFDPYSVN